MRKPELRFASYDKGTNRPTKHTKVHKSKPAGSERTLANAVDR
jgi:hypothetical protein